MLLHYYKTLPNFGDALNPWLWPQLLPGRFSPPAADGAGDPDTLFLGIGTILQRSVPAAGRYIVFGSGAGYGDLPSLDSRWEFHAVRGPFTAAALGLPAELAVTDAAYLLALVDLPSPQDGRAIGFMPHWRSLRRIPWHSICDLAGLRFINPLARVESVLGDIRGCDCVITEAMHGAIVADLLRVPWVPVRLGEHFLDFKWRDWLSAMETECTAIPLQAMDPWTEHRESDGVRTRAARRAFNIVGYYARSAPLTFQLRQLRRRIERGLHTPSLSADRVFRERLSTLERRLDHLRETLPVLDREERSPEPTEPAPNTARATGPVFGTAPSRV